LEVELTFGLVQVPHAHRALPFYDQPLVDAVVVKVVVAGPQDLYELRV